MEPIGWLEENEEDSCRQQETNNKRSPTLRRAMRVHDSGSLFEGRSRVKHSRGV